MTLKLNVSDFFIHLIFENQPRNEILILMRSHFR